MPLMDDAGSGRALAHETRDAAASDGHLWPSPDYARQVDGLLRAVGETVYIAELELTDVQLGARLTDKPYVLLGVVDFPRPDPARGLAPHLVLLDDGRGVNLGRIARITRSRPFSPAPSDVLYRDEPMLQGLLFNERRLSPAFIAAQSKRLLGELLGGRTVTAAALPRTEPSAGSPDGP
jgi:hypothetical protein